MLYLFYKVKLPFPNDIHSIYIKKDNEWIEHPVNDIYEKQNGKWIKIS